MAVYGDSAAGRNLVSAFTDATGTFDPAYVGSKNNLLNFRNYQVASAIDTCAIGVGGSFGGGKIVYYLQVGDPGYKSWACHGIIAAATDQSSGIQWYNGTNILVGTSLLIGSGANNTTSIVASQGSGWYAAQLCQDLVLNGFSDWFLPSVGELEKLYLSRTAIGGFGATGYLSSSEEPGAYAISNSRAIYFVDGSLFTPYKSSSLYSVRAIRSF